MLKLVILMTLNALCSSSIYCSEDDMAGGHSVVRSNVRPRTPIHTTVLRVNSMSDDDLCDDIVRSTFIGQSIHICHIRPCLIEVIRQSKSSPTANEDISDASGMAIKAALKALDRQQLDVDERWSRAQAAIASVISSSVVALIVGLVQHFTSK